MKPGDLIKFHKNTTLWKTPLYDLKEDDPVGDIYDDSVGTIVSMFVDPDGAKHIDHILVLVDHILGWTESVYVKDA